jgi:uncharacterized protein with NRDE domain
MCTLIAAVSASPGTPLIIAANRDERLDRAASGPMIWPGPPRFVAPRDDVAGGTWLGVNAHGLFVGVTNRAAHPRDPARRSRGALVVEALGSRSARELHRAMAGVDPRAFNGFHLVYGDRDGAHVTWSDGEKSSQASLEPGLHVITERSFTGAAVARELWIRDAWSARVAGRAPTPETLGPILAHHDDGDPFASVCVHADAFNYGTRSSSILVLRDALAASRLYWNDGRPCASPFREVDELAIVLADDAAPQ